MSLAFLETGLLLDASGLTIGGSSNNTLTSNLTIDQRSTSTALTSFTVTVSANTDTTLPFTPILATSIDGKVCVLTLTFNQPITSVHFGNTYTLTITGADASTYTLSVIVNYANNYSDTNWTNTTNSSLLVADLDNKSSLSSLPLNNKLRSLLQSALTGLNQAYNYIKYYSYKEKYLNDIIDFAIAAGSSYESSTSTVTYNTSGQVATITTTYGNTSRPRTQNIIISYTYANYTLNRLQLRSGIYTTLTTETVSLISGFTVNAIDGSGNLVYNLGTITLNRSLTPTIYSIPYLLDYNSTLSSDVIATDPDNILSDYKYYQTNTITGWTIA
jgi:hypothetical protein